METNVLDFGRHFRPNGFQFTKFRLNRKIIIQFAIHARLTIHYKKKYEFQSASLSRAVFPYTYNRRTPPELHFFYCEEN